MSSSFYYSFMNVDVTTTFFEMTSPHDLNVKVSSLPLEVRRLRIPIPELNRFFYVHVGHNHYWYDRLNWSYDQWKIWAGRTDLQTWVIYLEDTPAGYFELETLDERVNIIFFGLLPQFIGQGIGAHALTLAVQTAWNLKPNRVTLNTCTLDHPHALHNYQSRGFKVYRKITEMREISDSQPDLWPGANYNRQ